MRLTSLTLQGFKSFGNRISVEFAPGVTAIVGPNGSGKSNLVDALKWTSGGGRAREFRAADKTDLIFHGASGKRSVGLAEVEVELSHGDQTLKLYRSLSRDGTTRLRLNGKAARFLDLDEALAGSGLGKSGLSIIGQGEVSQVLMADPPKLLDYVAEVAGVARMSARREQTLARLETARSHLERLQDVILELDERCRALDTEAAEAERHAALSAEALRLRFTAAVARCDALTTEIGALHLRQAQLESAIAEGRESLASVRTELARVRREQDEAEVAYRSALADAELRKGDLRVAEERAQHAQQRRQATVAALRSVRTEAEALEQAEPPTPPEGDTTALATREAALADRLQALEGALRDAQIARNERAQERDALQRSRAQAEQEFARYEAHHASLTQQADEIAARMRELSAVDGDDLVALENAYTRCKTEAEAAEAALDEQRSRLTEIHQRQANAAAESMARERASQRQRVAFESRQGYAQGPRNALTSGIAGVVGSVADLLRVPEAYQIAVAAALGRRAEYVVVDTAETGRDVLRYVRARGGYVTVLPLDLLRSGRSDVAPALLQRAGVIGSAAGLVEVDARYRGVRDQMLGNTLLMETMDAATALARSASSRPRMVSLEGDILEASGAMSGGQRSQHASVLGAAAELEEAEALAADAADEAAQALAQLEQAQAAMRDAQARAREATATRAVAQRAWSEARERASSQAGVLDELNARQRATAAALAELVPPAETFEPGALESAETAAAAADAALEGAREATLRARAEHGEVRQERLVLEERWRSYQQAALRHERELERAVALRAEESTLATALEQQVLEADAAAAAVEVARAALPTGIDAVARSLDEARAKVAALEQGMTRRTEQQAAHAQELEECRVQRARRDVALELAQEERDALPSGIDKLELSERSARQRLREASEALEALGAVNHRAARDLHETRERKETLEVESAEASLAVNELDSTLERIDRETTERLGEALGRLRVAFAEHVRQLFGTEGHGDLDIELEEGQRPVGIRIRLQPPGKQTQSLHLLSVGERTMGALAFLFALMADGEGAAGLPIAVLDEVDAPLDEANIRRYCGFVRRLAETGTQFILITHQKATFEVADVLWGVTTEQGVSRVFSIRREDAVA